MGNLVSINELKSMIQEKIDLIRFYKNQIPKYERDLEILKNALESRTQKENKK